MTAQTVIESGAVIEVPLNKLKKHPRNARKTPHLDVHIEALAASMRGSRARSSRRWWSRSAARTASRPASGW